MSEKTPNPHQLTPEMQKAQSLFQLACDIDAGTSSILPEIVEVGVRTVDVKTLEIVFSGLMDLPQVRQFLAGHPDGAFADIARGLRERFVQQGEFTVQGFNQWTGLKR